VHLVVAAIMAILIGGFWYLRNAALHGSPLWPTVGMPWGDARSSYFDGAPRFFDQPFGYFVHVLNHRVKAGGIPLLLAGVLTPFISRRPAVRACALITALGTLLWMFTPFSGETAFATTRYLFPVMGAAAAALVLAAGKQGVRHAFVLLFLLASISWNMFQLTGPIDGFVRPYMLLSGAAVGGLFALAAPAKWIAKVSSIPPVLRATGVAVVTSALLLVFVPGYLQRHLDVERGRQRADAIVPVARWLTDQDRFTSGGDPIAMTWSLYGPLTGDHLQHSLALVRDGAACSVFDHHADTGWLIIRRSDRGREVPGYQHARECVKDRSPVYNSAEYVVFSEKTL
jgi:hypothetical protein